jgi:DNA-binding NarL/FixJ family response regulator
VSKHVTKNTGAKVPPDTADASTRAARILVADGDAIFREGLAKLLSGAFSASEILCVEGGEQARQSLAHHSWDVVLLGMDGFGKEGMDLLKAVVKMRASTLVIVLTARHQSRFAAKTIHAGAIGYVVKSDDKVEIVDAVKSALAGKPYMNAAMTETPAAILHPSPELAPQELLSEREYQVMKLIALGRSVKEIAFELELSVKTVNTYRTRIMDKADLRTTADIIRYSAQEKQAPGNYFEGA